MLKIERLEGQLYKFRIELIYVFPLLKETRLLYPNGHHSQWTKFNMKLFGNLDVII